MMVTETMSSSSSKQDNLKKGIESIKIQENKNITRDGAVILKK